MTNRLLTLGIPGGFDVRRISPGSLVAWYDASRISNRVDGDPLLVWRNLVSTSALPQFDTFTRANSTTTLGSAESGVAWTVVQGTGGISLNKAYFASDTNLDMAVIETNLSNGVVSCVINGDLDTTGSNFSIPQILVRYLDADNYLLVSAADNAVRLSKRVAGVETSLQLSGASTTTDNTDYTLRTTLNGNLVTVHKDGTSLISYTLTGAGETAFSAYTKHGIRLRKTGTPSFNARWDNFIVARLSDAIQGTTANQPSYQTNEQNSRPVVRFDGAASHLIADHLATYFTGSDQPLTVFAVFKPNSTTPVSSTVVGAGRSSSNNPIFAPIGTASAAWRVFRRDDAASSVDKTILSITAGTTYLATNIFTGTTFDMLANGSSQLQTACNVGTLTLDTFTIGALRRLSTSDYIDGDVAAILVFNAALSTAQRRKVERWLSRTYGVSLVNTLVSDTFTRSDSALTLGNAETGQTWEALAGTPGISSNKAYFASDANNDLAVVQSGAADGTIQCVMSGDLDTTGSNWSVPRLVLRLTDATSFLCVTMQNSNIYLQKFASSVYTTLTSAATTTTDNTDYAIRVVMSGNSLTVYKDGTSVLTHTLAGGNTVYSAYTKHGIQLSRGGTPSFNARWDSFVVEAA